MIGYPEDAECAQEFEVVGEVGIGLILLESQYGRQIWVECVKRLNTHKSCEICGKDLFHQLDYRSINNAKNHGQRICIKCVKEKMIVKPGDPRLKN